MGRTRHITKDADVGASYESLAKLFGLDRSRRVRIIEGELQVQTAGLVYVVQEPGTAPEAAAVGIGASSGQSRTFGPNSPWYLDSIWVKQSAVGSRVVFAGVVEE